MRDHHLLDRDEDLGLIEGSLRRLGTGRGAMVIIEGAAGIGKSSLLEWTRGRAVDLGATVLSAQGSELEERFAFGVVRQLFEAPVVTASPEDRTTWSAGAARLAVSLFDPEALSRPALSRPAGDEATYQLLHGLYWLIANLSDRAPLALVIDDAHWADQLSLQLLGFLASRLEPMPVMVVAGTRPGRAELDALTLHPAVQVGRPRALSATAVTSWVADALGASPADSFAQACAHATGGNPFLLAELLREVRAEGIKPDGEHAAAVASLTPRAVTTSVLLRLGRLSPAATTLAQALAVLQTAELDIAATLAGLDADAADDGAAQLGRAELLRTGPVLSFVHPLIRTAIYEQLSPRRRAEFHARAGELLAGCGAEPHRVAAHVLLTPPPTPWAVPALRQAARNAMALGSPATAAGYLGRVVAEAQPTADYVETLIELGRAQVAAGIPSAEPHLRQAADSATDLRQLTDACVTLARLQRSTGHGLRAVETLEAARRRVGPSGQDLQARIDTELLACASLSASARLRLGPWLRHTLRDPAHPPQTPWEYLCVASLALDAALDGQPAHDVANLAARTMTGAAALADPMIRNQVLTLAGVAYLLIDRFAEATAVYDQLIDETAARGLIGAHVGMLAHRASLHQRLGQLDQARELATRALDLDAEVHGAQTLVPRAAAVIVSVAAEQRVQPPARFITDDIDPDNVSFRLLSYSRAELLIANGQYAPAAAALLAYGDRNHQLGWNGTASPWRAQAALCLHHLGDSARARQLAGEELDIARQAGAPRALGIALRTAGLLAEGDDRPRLLAEAAGVLAESPALLERAWTLAHCGIDRHRQHDLPGARDLLRQAHQLAVTCGATRLADLTATRVHAVGGRARTIAYSGQDALTSAERRVADLAATGHTNRQIAQALFVTEKTVETHLAHAYRKLGIRSRHDLPRR
ncbi:MAG TPA: AAA family ATPase [Streptosporangiaceae bacterium]